MADVGEGAQHGVAAAELQLVFAHAPERRVVGVSKPGRDFVGLEGVVASDRLGSAQVAQLVEDIDAVGMSALVVVDSRQLDLREMRKAGDELLDVEPVVAGEWQVVDRGRRLDADGVVPSQAVSRFFMRAPVGPWWRRGRGTGSGRAARA